MKIESENSLVQIDIIKRSNPNSNDYWDGNWLKANIKIDVSGFKSDFKTNLRSDDFQRFYSGLIKLQNNLSKEVEFNTMEEGLYLKGNMEITGNIKWESISKSDDDNTLKVFFETNVTTIELLTTEIEEILNSFPIVGNI